MILKGQVKLDSITSTPCNTHLRRNCALASRGHQHAEPRLIVTQQLGSQHQLSTRKHSRRTSIRAQGNLHIGSLDAKGLRIGIVIARFNELVTKLLLEGALEALQRHGGADSDVVWVPGSFEVPLVAKALAKSGKFDAVLTIGTVVRGATTHYEAVVNSATGGSLSAAMESGVPVVFGVLTTETMEQALDRAGGKAGNKGYECAVTAIEMANLMKSLRALGLAAEPWGLNPPGFSTEVPELTDEALGIPPVPPVQPM